MWSSVLIMRPGISAVCRRERRTRASGDARIVKQLETVPCNFRAQLSQRMNENSHCRSCCCGRSCRRRLSLARDTSPISMKPDVCAGQRRNRKLGHLENATDDPRASIRSISATNLNSASRTNSSRAFISPIGSHTREPERSSTTLLHGFGARIDLQFHQSGDRSDWIVDLPGNQSGRSAFRVGIETDRPEKFWAIDPLPTTPRWKRFGKGTAARIVKANCNRLSARATKSRREFPPASNCCMSFFFRNGATTRRSEMFSSDRMFPIANRIGL